MNKTYFKIFTILSFLALPIVVFAAELINPLGSKDMNIYDLIGRIVKALLGVAGSASLLMFVYGGFQYLVSGGDATKVKKGKDTLVNAALGLAIIFGAFMVVNQLITYLTTATSAS